MLLASNLRMNGPCGRILPTGRAARRCSRRYSSSYRSGRDALRRQAAPAQSRSAAADADDDLARCAGTALRLEGFSQVRQFEDRRDGRAQLLLVGQGGQLAHLAAVGTDHEVDTADIAAAALTRV